MKRDCDLVRQILLNVEHRGATCPLEALRADLRHESDERLHYHLQLVIDAGWVTEVERSVAGPLGVRLTHAGHEFVEVARGDVCWRAAKAVVIEETGGLSLGLLRALLIKWAWRTVVRSERLGRLRRPRQLSRRRRPRRRIRRYEEGALPVWWEGAYAPGRDSVIDDDQVRDDQIRIERHRRGRGHLKPLRSRDGFGVDLYAEVANELDERPQSVTLPPHMI